MAYLAVHALPARGAAVLACGTAVVLALAAAAGLDKSAILAGVG